MFPETYGFSAQFTVNFWIQTVRFKNPLLQLAMTVVEDAFSDLGWKCTSSLRLKLLCGCAEPMKESKLSEFCRTKVNPLLMPGTLSLMRLMPDSITWEFQEADSGVTAKVDFYIRKRGFFNRPEQERLSSIIRRLFEQVAAGVDKYSLGISFNRNDRNA